MKLAVRFFPLPHLLNSGEEGTPTPFNDHSRFHKNSDCISLIYPYLLLHHCLFFNVFLFLFLAAFASTGHFIVPLTDCYVHIQLQ